MKKLVLVTMLAGFSFAASSQAEADPGTFQLMTTMVKAQEVFSTEVLFVIEANRDMDELVVIKVGEHTWARILSRATINDPSFMPLPDGVIEIDPNDSLISVPTLSKD